MKHEKGRIRIGMVSLTVDDFFSHRHAGMILDQVPERVKPEPGKKGRWQKTTWRPKVRFTKNTTRITLQTAKKGLLWLCPVLTQFAISSFVKSWEFASSFSLQMPSRLSWKEVWENWWNHWLIFSSTYFAFGPSMKENVVFVRWTNHDLKLGV